MCEQNILQSSHFLRLSERLLKRQLQVPGRFLFQEKLVILESEIERTLVETEPPGSKFEYEEKISVFLTAMITHIFTYVSAINKACGNFQYVLA